MTHTRDISVQINAVQNENKQVSSRLSNDCDAQYTTPTPTRRNSTVASRRRCVLGLMTVMYLDSKRLDVVCAVSSAGEVGQVELDLVPSFVESHWHSTDERLDARCALVVTGAESSTNILVVQHLQQSPTHHHQYAHRRRRRGAGGTCPPPKIREKIFLGQLLREIRAFFGQKSREIREFCKFFGQESCKVRAIC